MKHAVALLILILVVAGALITLIKMEHPGKQKSCRTCSHFSETAQHCTLEDLETCHYVRKRDRK